MNLPFFIALIFALQIFYWLVGRRASRNLETREAYLLADKQVRFFPLMMTFLATQVGGGLVLGAANEAYQYGWPVLLYPLGASLGMLLLGAVGKRLAEFKVSTVAELFELIYGSTQLRKLASAFSILTLFMIFVAQIIASSKFLVSIGLINTPLSSLLGHCDRLYRSGWVEGGYSDRSDAGLCLYASVSLLLWLYLVYRRLHIAIAKIRRVCIGVE